MDLTKVSLQVALVVTTTTTKYRVGEFDETSLELVSKLITSGDFDLELVSGWLDGGFSGVLLLTEKEVA